MYVIQHKIQIFGSKYFVLVIHSPLEVQHQLLLPDQLLLQAGDPQVLVLLLLLHVRVISVYQRLGQGLTPVDKQLESYN